MAHRAFSQLGKEKEMKELFAVLWIVTVGLLIYREYQWTQSVWNNPAKIVIQSEGKVSLQSSGDCTWHSLIIGADKEFHADNGHAGLSELFSKPCGAICPFCRERISRWGKCCVCDAYVDGIEDDTVTGDVTIGLNDAPFDKERGVLMMPNGKEVFIESLGLHYGGVQDE